MIRNFFRRFGRKSAPASDATTADGSPGQPSNPIIAPGSSSTEASSLAPPTTLPDDVQNALLARPEPPKPDSLVIPVGPDQARPNPQTIQNPQDPEKPV